MSEPQLDNVSMDNQALNQIITDALNQIAGSVITEENITVARTKLLDALKILESNHAP